MKKNLIHEVVQYAAIISVFVFGLAIRDILPTMIPSHWNAAGEIDGYSPKTFAIWFFPALILGMKVLFSFLKKLDPKKDKYVLFERSWKNMETVIIVFFSYIHIISLLAALEVISDASRLMVAGIGLFFVLLGNYMGKIRQNYFVGFKLPWTLSDEENWNRTHRLAGKTMVVAGLAVALSSFTAPIFRTIAFVIAMIGGFVVPCIFSYLIYRKKKAVSL